jgi:AcrR family transcriptional regulator
MNANQKRNGRPRTFDRDAVLKAAMEAFWAHGYEGASIALLTDAMGVSLSSLYAAFGSKEALYREALELYGSDPPMSAGPKGSTYRQLEQMLRRSAARFTEPGKPPGCMMLTGSLRGGAEASGAIRAAAHERGERLADMAHWLRRAQVAGDLPQEVDADGLASFYMAVLQGMSVQAVDGADAAALSRIADFALARWPGARPAK